MSQGGSVSVHAQTRPHLEWKHTIQVSGTPANPPCLQHLSEEGASPIGTARMGATPRSQNYA
jgi:hypothetical protein